MTITWLLTNDAQIRPLWQKFTTIISVMPADKLPLDLVESLLCAAFLSTHREVVNIAAGMWNKIYGTTEHIEYPEKLKEVLSSLGSSVDIARPGLEVFESVPDRHADFSQSQDQSLDSPLASRLQLQPTPQRHRRVLSRSVTPASAKAQDGNQAQPSATSMGQGGTRGRTLRSKPRHEDSQLEFTVIESSPAPVAQASQVLTDRQREVRERQLENATLFPQIRSSPTEKTKKARSNTVHNQQETASRSVPRASTPDNDRDFDDDCLTSTPTPRRGQSVMLPVQDQDMTDPPSSPPEPRSHRLLAELKAQAKDQSSMDEWQFSSSPVSGSPNLANPTIAASQSMHLDEVTEELRLDEEEGDGTNSDFPASQDEVIEDTTMLEFKETVALPALQQGAHHQTPITPSGRQLRSRTVQITPRSDNEEFVDAPSSPLPPTPSHNKARKIQVTPAVRRSPRNFTNSQSFAVSASFENGLRGVGSGRIEIPVRSSERSSPRKKQYRSFKDILPVSPEQAHEANAESEHQAQQHPQPQQTQTRDVHEDEGALSTIEVGGKSSKNSKRGRPRRSNRTEIASSSQPSQAPQAPEVPVPSTVAAITGEDFENVSPGIGRWWRKRKRSISSISSSGGSKKARHYDALGEKANQDEIPDSQPDAAVNEANPASYIPTGSHDRGVETQIVEELYEHDISIPSNLSSSPVLRRPRELFQELCASDDSLQIAAEPSTTHVQMVDTTEHTDDEEAILSQLTREEEEAAAGKARVLSEDIAAVPQGMPEPSTPTEDVRGENAEPTKFDSLMSLLRSGLDTMRSADLTREQFYQAEDMFFEMRRELLEAERRGRKD